MALHPFATLENRDTSPERAEDPAVKIADRFGVLPPQEVVIAIAGQYMDKQDRAWSGGLVRVLAELGFSSAASRVALNRLLGRGIFIPEKEQRFVFYRPTSRLELLREEGRRQMQAAQLANKKADVWTTVLYIAAEDERAQRSRLNRWLSFRGFGSLHDNFWIAPGDVENETLALIDKLHFNGQTVVFVGQFAKATKLREFIARAWKLDELRIMYVLLAVECRKTYDRPDDSFSIKEAFLVRTKLMEMFRQTMLLNVPLPDELLGIEWERTKALEMFKSLEARLEAKARAYFRETVVTGVLEDA
jgi:phenylacetic acid degradation operon negative regulatory protein